MPIQIQGGPALNVVADPSGARVEGGSAIPVAVVSDARAVGGTRSATRVVVVTNPDHVEGGPAIPVIASPAGTPVEGGPAMRVYVVQGSLGSDPLAYTNKIIALAPTAYWPLAEASGTTIVDASGNGRNGAYKAAGEPLLGQTGIGDGRTAALFDGVNDYGNLFSASLQGAFNGSEGTLALWIRVANAGVWTDGIDRRLINLRVDASNRVQVDRGPTNNQVSCTYIAGGTSKGVSFTTAAPLTWLHLAVTWSKAADQVKFYVSGIQQGVTQTGLGVWAGVLAPTLTILGASDSAGSNVTSGYLAHAAVWGAPLSAATIATLAVVP